MNYFIDEPFFKSIRELNSKGGQFQKAADKTKKICYDINDKVEKPFHGIPLTNHGESRVKNCIKYDLIGFARLITIQHDGLCTLKYVGTHDDCDKWLEKNKGLNLAISSSTKELVDVKKSEDLRVPSKRLSDDSDYSEGKLIDKLKSYSTKLEDLISYGKYRPFLTFESVTSEDEILEACYKIEHIDTQNLFFDVFICLKKGDIDAAKNRILEFTDDLTLVETLLEADSKEFISNDQYQKLNELEGEYLKGLLETKDWYNWMLFLHPTQRQAVDADFKGSAARLLGVSGSGKTCIIVHRAVRLAEKYSNEKILILTLNHSLSKLIQKLIDILLDSSSKQHLSSQIEVRCFWEVCQEMLEKFEDNPLANRIFSSKTDIHNETIEDIWEEYYTCQNNNLDAEILFPTHQNLLARSIFPQNYLKQEFDWIRSAFAQSNRDEYIKVEREGRYIPIQEQERHNILKALKGWDEKMSDVGAIDYLGLANALVPHIDKIQPKYRSILVDEVQDFGTLELKIIRKLCSENENDLFICGDIAQQVYTKHHKIRQAGFNILPANYTKILKNYRNSREILEASYAVFKNNISEESLKSDDFEILNPEYANFSSPKPFLRKGDSLNSEFNSALEYLKGILEDKEKGCISICGGSMFDISKLGLEIGVPVLDGEMDLSTGKIFLSDLEQTKGFEFDRMIIINCSKSVIPNSALPKEEWYREMSKLYVAMTRAKKELILSFSNQIADIFSQVEPYFTADSWSDHLVPKHNLELPISFNINADTKFSTKSGKDFLYSKQATGISRELQIKLIETVAGKSVIEKGNKKIGWRNMNELFQDVQSSHRDVPTLNRVFGPVVFKELEMKVNSLEKK
jgi:hypothetical protein